MFSFIFEPLSQNFFCGLPLYQSWRWQVNSPPVPSTLLASQPQGHYFVLVHRDYEEGVATLWLRFVGMLWVRHVMGTLRGIEHQKPHLPGEVAQLSTSTRLNLYSIHSPGIFQIFRRFNLQVSGIYKLFIFTIFKFLILNIFQFWNFQI